MHFDSEMSRVDCNVNNNNDSNNDNNNIRRILVK